MLQNILLMLQKTFQNLMQENINISTTNTTLKRKKQTLEMYLIKYLFHFMRPPWNNGLTVP